MTKALPGLDRVARALAPHHLDIFGAFAPGPEDGAPDFARTLVLVGPAEPGFWPYVTGTPEFQDGAADPLDRWSRRVLTDLAPDLDAEALFPFGGPPYQPFIAWAQRSGRAWLSPVGILVHDTAGLMVSYRGALALRWDAALAPLGPAPCDGCAAPCLSACPVAALSATGYDVPVCHSFLDSAPGETCLSGGCLVRRACPVSQSYGRLPEQSAFHMKSFHP